MSYMHADVSIYCEDYPRNICRSRRLGKIRRWRRFRRLGRFLVVRFAASPFSRESYYRKTSLTSRHLHR